MSRYIIFCIFFASDRFPPKKRAKKIKVTVGRIFSARRRTKQNEQKLSRQSVFETRTWENNGTPVVRRSMRAAFRIVAGRFNRRVSARNSYIIAGNRIESRVPVYTRLWSFCFLRSCVHTSRSIRCSCLSLSLFLSLLIDRTIFGNSTTICNNWFQAQLNAECP